ncbi:MFS transporter, partial [Nostoc sp. NIES-2111]
MSNQNQHDPFAALRLRSYQLFLTGRVFSLMGYQMQNVAVGWELYERTNSALALGVVGLVQVLPSIVLTLPAGHVADRWDRKRTVLLTQLMLAVGSLGLAFLSYTQGSIY